jgi:hypothetical protein
MKSLQEQVIEETTKDFVGAFPSKEDCKGSMGFLIAQGILPDCVDSENPQVIQIIKWFQDNRSGL